MVVGLNADGSFEVITLSILSDRDSLLRLIFLDRSIDDRDRHKKKKRSQCVLLA